jgi:hypothetical protein
MSQNSFFSFHWICLSLSMCEPLFVIFSTSLSFGFTLYGYNVLFCSRLATSAGDPPTPGCKHKISDSGTCLVLMKWLYRYKGCYQVFDHGFIVFLSGGGRPACQTAWSINLRQLSLKFLLMRLHRKAIFIFEVGKSGKYSGVLQAPIGLQYHKFRIVLPVTS